MEPDAADAHASAGTIAAMVNGPDACVLDVRIHRAERMPRPLGSVVVDVEVAGEGPPAPAPRAAPGRSPRGKHVRQQCAHNHKQHMSSTIARLDRSQGLTRAAQQCRWWTARRRSTPGAGWPCPAACQQTA